MASPSESQRPELEEFAQQFDPCIKSRPTRNHFRAYVAGQISDLPRKSVVPIARHAGVSPRTLQEFLSLHRWDDETMRERLQQIVAERHAHPDAIGIIEEIKTHKQGDKTPGVQQHRLPDGRVENCVVTVHLGYAAGPFHALLDSDLYLPSRSWHADRERCRSAGIPDDVVYRPKWRIALAMLTGAVQRGVSLRWICADAAYGSVHRFRRGAARLGVRYVVEVDPETTGWVSRRTEEARPVGKLWKRAGPAWETYNVPDGRGERRIAHVRAVRFRPAEAKVPGSEQWLLIARGYKPEEPAYFLSNAPADTPVVDMLTAAFARTRLERLFAEAKREAGFHDYEGRRHKGLKRHLVLTAVSLLFLAEQKQRAALGP